MDHLDGILYPMRMTDFTRFGFNEELARGARERAAMMAPPERSTERDAALLAMLPRVAFEGWTRLALRRALAESGGHPDDAERLFPRGSVDMVEAYCDLADRRMEEAAAAEGVAELRLSQRVRALIALRLRQAEPEREAVRRGRWRCWPRRGGRRRRRGRRRALSTRSGTPPATARPISVGTPSAPSWREYTGRRCCAGCPTAASITSDTLAFLDRRLAGVARLGRLRGRFAGGRPAAGRAAA